MPRVDPEFRRALALLDLLAHPIRLAVLLKLRESAGPVGPSEIRADLAATVSQSNFNVTLRALVVSRLVEGRRRGKAAAYSLTAEGRERLGPLFELAARTS